MADRGLRTYRTKRSRYFKIDLRLYGKGRMTMRDPNASGWPEGGARTDDEEVASRWSWAYLDWVRGEKRKAVLGYSAQPEKALKDAVDAYLAMRGDTVKRATWSADRTALGVLLDEFGAERRLGDIDMAALQRIANRMSSEGYRASTLDTYFRSMRVFFRFFGLDPVGSLRREVSKGAEPQATVQLPKAVRADVETLSDGDIERLLLAAKSIDEQRIGQFPSAELACALGLFVGLRQGEIFAATWDAIDTTARTMRVTRQVPKDGFDFESTKSGEGRSPLILPEWWAYHRPAIGLIAGRTGGRPAGTRTQRNMITRVLDTAGLNRIGRGWHILRHTYARLVLERGGRLEELKEFLGHSSIVTTEQRYGHLSQAAAAKLAGDRIYGAWSA